MKALVAWIGALLSGVPTTYTFLVDVIPRRDAVKTVEAACGQPSVASILAICFLGKLSVQRFLEWIYKK